MYNLIVNRIIKYNLIINGFSKTDTLIFRSNEIISIIANFIYVMRGASVVSMLFKMEAIKALVVQRLTPSVNIGATKITSSVKLRGKISGIIQISFSSVIFIKEKLRVILTTALPLNIVATPIVGKFFTLVQHDNQTLGALDPFTLRDLDFIES